MKKEVRNPVEVKATRAAAVTGRGAAEEEASCPRTAGQRACYCGLGGTTEGARLGLSTCHTVQEGCGLTSHGVRNEAERYCLQRGKCRNVSL